MAEYIEDPVDNEESSFSVSEIFENILYYKKIFIAVVVIVFGITIVYALLATPIYKVDVLIQVEDKKGSALSNALDATQGIDSQGSSVSGQMEIYKSRNVIGRAVESLFLNTTVQVTNRIPFFYGLIYRLLNKNQDGLAIPPIDGLNIAWGGEDLIFDSFIIPHQYLRKPLTLKVGESGHWDLYDEFENRLATGKVGTNSVSSDGKWLVNIKLLKANPGTEFKLVQYSLLSRINQITPRLKTEESGKGSGLFRVYFEDPNPAFAQRLLNAVSQSYVDQNTERKEEEVEKTLKFLSRELPELSKKMDQAEGAFSDFRNQENTIDVPGEIQALMTRSSEIETQRLELEMKRSEMAQRYQPAHPYFKALNNQIAQLKAENASLEREISALPETQRKYVKYAKDAEISSKLYVNLLDMSQQLQITKAGTVGNVYIIDKAIIPEGPDKPNKMLIVAGGGLGAILLGGLVANLLGFILATLRDPKKLEETTGIRTFAVLPLSQEQREFDDNDFSTPHLLAKEKPNSMLVEGLRSLRIAIQFGLMNKTNRKVILLTSAVPGQGKSFISANLAYTLCSNGKKVLLIDADIRKSGLRHYFDIHHKIGLTDYLEERATKEDAIVLNAINNLDIIPSGKSIKNPGDVFFGNQLNELVKWGSENYDYVIIDSPPVLPVNDAVMLSRFSDLVLFVVRQNLTSMSETNQSLENFDKIGAKPDGFVFNGYTPSLLTYGSAYGYGSYGRYGRYGRYGSYGRYGGDENEYNDIEKNDKNIGFSTLVKYKALAKSKLSKLIKNLVNKIRSNF